MNIVFDIETNHYDFTLLDTLHCVVAQDVDTEKVYVFDKGNIADCIPFLMRAKTLIGHNIIQFDLPALKKFYPEFDWSHLTIRDTLIMSRMAKPKWFQHSLERWGNTLGFKKGDYAQDYREAAGDTYTKDDEWLTYSDEMREYCIQDVRVNRRVYLECMKASPFMFNDESLELEQYTTELMTKQQAIGVGFDRNKALELTCKLMSKKEELEAELSKSFTGFYRSKGLFTPKRNHKRLGYIAGSQCTKIEWVEFNPGSRDHVAYWLKRKYKWEPEEFTDGGKPKISETVLNDLSEVYPEAKPLAEYFMVNQRLSYLSTSPNSWLNSVTSEGRIHGYVNPQGTATYRAAHSKPNLGQVPSIVKDDKGNILTGIEGRYGSECRDLFTSGYGDDWCIMGCDMSGIEFRLLAHYLHRFDDGQLVDTVLNGDIHTKNQELAGLPSRAMAKTFIYAFIYGGADGRLGSIVGGTKAQGTILRARFLKNMPSLATLLARIQAYRKSRKGYIRALDGRHIPVDSQHTTLNYLLQSAGAILAKAWMKAFHILAEQEGIVWGRDYVQLLWVHDEVQCAVKRSVAHKLGELCVKAIEKVGKDYDLKCPITGKYALGGSWRETH